MLGSSQKILIMSNQSQETHIRRMGLLNDMATPTHVCHILKPMLSTKRIGRGLDQIGPA